jgi:hypothetical protein
MNSQNEIDINALLEQETRNNKADSWNKLNKTLKLQKLHAFSENYCKTNNLTHKDVKLLKQFFISCLDENKLQKTKDVQYNKEKGEIINIPLLNFIKNGRNFTLKCNDKKSNTSKSLTPIHIVKDEKTPSEESNIKN